MDKIARIIFEKVSSGELEKEIGLDILQELKEINTTNNQDIAVIGLSVNLPGASNLDEFWRNIRNKREFIRELSNVRKQDSESFILNFTHLDKKSIRYSYGGYLDNVDHFDYSFFHLSPNEAAYMDPNQRLFLESCWEAIEDAGYGGNKLIGSRTGVYLGYADWPVYGQYVSKNCPTFINTASVGNTPSIIASRISFLLNFQGPAFLVDTACSSSLVAIHLACTALKNNECEQAIAGGVKVSLIPAEGVFEIGIESSNRKTKTFDADSDGTVWGEGSIALLLKPLEKALSDNDYIYAVIKGSAMNQDGASVGITAPNAASQEKLLMNAWKDAGIDPETISYIEAHGTGTKLGDPIEIDGIRRAFRHFTDKKQFCGIGSVKTNIGHLDGTSGVAGLVKAIASLKYKELLPTINFSKPNSKIGFEDSPVYVNDRLQTWETGYNPRRCGVSSFGFSGTNCHVILEESPLLDENQSIDASGEIVLALSAKSNSALKELVEKYIPFLEDSQVNLHDICYTANTGRGHYNVRLAIIADDRRELIKKLNLILVQNFNIPPNNGIFFGEHRAVTVIRNDRSQGIITTEECRQLSDEANEQLLDIDNNNKWVNINTICQLYIKGANINWELYYKTENRRKVRVPTYPFQRVRCWIDTNDAVHEQLNHTEVRLTGRTDNDYPELEKQIATVWGETLGLTEIDVYADFFDLGGNSILAVKMEVDLERLNISVSSEMIYNYRSLHAIVEQLEKLDSKNVSNNFLSDEIIMDSLLQDSRLLERFNPFNDVFFKNCFYNSVFPIISHFQEDIFPFLLDDFILFTFMEADDGGKIYSVEYCASHELQDLFEDSNLVVESKWDHEKIIEDIIEGISGDRPVVVWVDSYYESIRKDTFLKQHLDHTILVYGYDKKNELFHVIEHDRRENLSYKKCIMPFTDIINGSEGYKRNFSSENKPSHYIFSHQKRERRKPDYVDIFAENIENHRDKLQSSMNALHQFNQYFITLASNELELRSQLDTLISFFNDVLNAKYIEKYRLTLLFGEDDEVVLHVIKLIAQWDHIRKSVLRFKYQPIYHTDMFQPAYEKLLELEADEKSFHITLFAKLDHVTRQNQL
ncbi:beta-ketoacyl synthase N-terminal-like domain-containing protein [Paenibacillus sp. UNC217MF]|uniref:beta-ketoacyl synthase N-terminal-like domain-containing protein n=1 Tax=Paenibacillus sp. UNC217MF TaxID=1449062 RepID=UPI000690A737|nr:beta-ketoacyl synthase N-terminal-like domain-containing protein [Paenibacillus sp. UNC217MF]